MGLFVELVMEVVLARQSLCTCAHVVTTVWWCVERSREKFFFLLILLESHRKTGVFLDRIADITFIVNLKGRLDQNS